MRITLAQTIIIPGKPIVNLEKAESLIALASAVSSDLILFPELWTSGYSFSKDIQRIALHNNDCIAELARISKLKKIMIAGSMVCHENDGYFNSFILTTYQSEHPIRYNKIHLFLPMNEDKYFIPGSRPVIHEIPGAKLGFAICFDIRFPELFTYYMKAGVNLVLVCGEWPLSRIEHWKTLLLARAMENQFFIAAVNCVGTIGKETFGGTSIVVDPAGNPLIIGSVDEPNLYTVDLDMNYVDDVREKFPVIKKRRPDVYN